MAVELDCEKSSQEQRIPSVCATVGYTLESPRESLTTGQAIRGVMPSKERVVEEKRLVQKLDFRFASTITLLYIVNYIVRNSIATARLKGLEHDLRLSDTQYDTAVASLFILYTATQVPFNMILNRVSRPSLCIGMCAIAWGVLCALIGITNNYGGILICRILLGLPEAAFFPGAIYLLSRWYTRKELALRTSFTLAGVMCSNAFGSLIAAGILSNMEGKRGIRGWRWVFIIEGAIAAAIGILSLWTLPDLPTNTRWLSHAERYLAQVRLAEDAGEADEDLTEDSMWSGLKMAIKDVKVFIFSLILLGDYLGLSFTNFFPSLAKTLGFDDTITLLVSAPPWIFAAIICCLNGFHADKTGERFVHVCNTMWGATLGFIIAVSTLSTGGRLAVILTWVSNSIPRPPAKRAAAIGIVGTCEIGSFVWKASWAPEYRQSMIISIVALTFSSILAFLMRYKLKCLNKKLDEDEMGALKGVNRERVEDAARLEVS
ncbi:hypothetical protein ACEPAG_3276 [Sanghuangporus baumii]